MTRLALIQKIHDVHSWPRSPVLYSDAMHKIAQSLDPIPNRKEQTECQTF